MFSVQGLGWKIHVLDPDHANSAALSRYFLLLSLGTTREFIIKYTVYINDRKQTEGHKDNGNFVFYVNI